MAIDLKSYYRENLNDLGSSISPPSSLITNYTDSLQTSSGNGAEIGLTSINTLNWLNIYLNRHAINSFPGAADASLNPFSGGVGIGLRFGKVDAVVGSNVNPLILLPTALVQTVAASNAFNYTNAGVFKSLTQYSQLTFIQKGGTGGGFGSTNGTACGVLVLFTPDNLDGTSGASDLQGYYALVDTTIDSSHAYLNVGFFVGGSFGFNTLYSAIVTFNNGDILKLTAVVSDPFGAADVTLTCYINGVSQYTANRSGDIFPAQGYPAIGCLKCGNAGFQDWKNFDGGI